MQLKALSRQRVQTLDQQVAELVAESVKWVVGGRYEQQSSKREDNIGDEHQLAGWGKVPSMELKTPSRWRVQVAEQWAAENVGSRAAEQQSSSWAMHQASSTRHTVGGGYEW
jgi:hypothetical protein